MPTVILRRLGTALVWSWRVLDATRRALLNLLLLALLVGLAWLALRSGTPALQERTTLVLAPNGPIREQFGAGLRASALGQLRGRSVAQTRLRDLLAVLDAAAQDPKIERLLLMTDDLGSTGLASLHEVAAAIDRFKASGKPVVAWGSGFDQRQYFVAARANEVWMHPMGTVELVGLGSYRNYYKDALDRIGVTAHVLRAGQYKNAAESFSASAPSRQTLEADRTLYDALWAGYTGAVEQARRLGAGSVQQGIEGASDRLAAAGGDSARMALDAHLVDALKTRDEVRALLVERGVKDGKTFRQIGFPAYLARLKPPSAGDAVGVVVAEGPIVDGVAPAGTVGGLSTAELVRQAREDERIKAVVLRVDSPGGSAFGAELVRHELALTRAAGKPVVVSMGDVAASGGYWISLAADEVIADEATITGSIGVVALLPSAERGLDKLGVHSGGYATSWLVGAYDPRRGLDPRFAKLVQAGVDHVYADFTAKAAAARKTTREAIDAVGQGRVWTGAQARERGLVDRTGSLGDALKAAAERAKLPANAPVRYLDRDPGRIERLLGWLGTSLGLSIEIDATAPLGALPAALLDGLRDDVSWLAGLADGRRPFSALAHCLCAAP